jgi:hypothetical protein
MFTSKQYSMKTTLLLISSVLMATLSFSDPVSWVTAKIAAQKHFQVMAEHQGFFIPGIATFNYAFVYTTEGLSAPDQDNQKQALFYIFNLNEKKGFIIISADDCTYPVIGYSFTGTFTGENLPPAVQGMLEMRAEEITALVQSGSKASTEIKNAWAELLIPDKSMTFKSPTSVDPLMSTTWDQAPFYNELCPYDNNYNELTVTGCPATAMAQIMKYWNYPEQGTGYHSYNTENYGTLSANFGATTYEWASMPNSINSSNNPIATLMFHCGVSVEMQYGVAATGGSGGYVIEAQSPIQHCCEYAYKTYFGYKPTMQGLFRENYNEANWIQMLKTDLDAGRPVQYAGFGQGGGHTWVCDGYDANNYFHMNWGWGGTYDGYFSINSLAPGSGGAGGGSGNFNSGQQALFGIEPETGGGGGSTQFDLAAYSSIIVEPDPISFTDAFSVNVDIANLDDNNFSGNLAAWLFNAEGAFVDVIQELSGVNMQTQYYYSFTFETTGLLATPGNYFIGIYYKATGGNWAIIGAGSYSNYTSVSIVGPDNTMQMYAELVLNPESVISGEPFQVTAVIGNYDTYDFSGMVSADLYDAEGTYLGELASTSLDLTAGYYVEITFNCPGAEVEPGSYILAIWDQPDGGDWNLVGSVNYPNPITIQIASPQLPPDIYETNDEQAQAYNFPLNFAGDLAVVETTESTIHNGNDIDFYKVDLPSGFEYKFTIRAHDSYNSGNGITYTDDVLWAVGVGSWWSQVFDDIMEGSFAVSGGQPVYFAVSNYYQGNTGTYLLEIKIEKGTFGVDEAEFSGNVSLFPNPARNRVTLASEDWNSLKAPFTIDIYDLQGRIVFRHKDLVPESSRIEIDLPILREGQYLLSLKGKNGLVRKKLIIAR